MAHWPQSRAVTSHQLKVEATEDNLGEALIRARLTVAIEPTCTCTQPIIERHTAKHLQAKAAAEAAKVLEMKIAWRAANLTVNRLDASAVFRCLSTSKSN